MQCSQDSFWRERKSYGKKLKLMGVVQLFNGKKRNEVVKKRKEVAVLFCLKMVPPIFEKKRREEK